MSDTIPHDEGRARASVTGLSGYVADQIYLSPHPKELMLRNHV